MKFMVSSPISLWQIEWEKVEAVTNFFFLGSKITVDGDCSPEIRRRLLHGRKTMTNLDSILKPITLPTKVRIVKAMVFPVVMYRCECWTIKKAESQEWIVMLEKTLESPLDSKETKPVNLEGNQLWIFTGRTQAESEATILLATRCKEPTYWKRLWCWERVKAKVEESGRRWDG